MLVSVSRWHLLCSMISGGLLQRYIAIAAACYCHLFSPSYLVTILSRRSLYTLYYRVTLCCL